MLQNVDPDLLKWVILAVILILAVAMATPLLTVISYARTRKEDLERAFNSQPIGVQQAGEATANKLNEAAIALVNSARLARDITDKDPNTPQYAPYTGDPVSDAIGGMQVLAHFPHRALTAQEINLVQLYGKKIAENFPTDVAIAVRADAPSG